MQNVHLKCWNDKSHCQVSVVGLKSLDVSPCNELLLLAMIIKNSLVWEYFFTHKTFGVQWTNRVTGSTGSPGRWIPGHKMWPSSISDLHKGSSDAASGYRYYNNLFCGEMGLLVGGSYVVGCYCMSNPVSSCYTCTISVCNQPTRSSQPCIQPASLYWVPA